MPGFFILRRIADIYSMCGIAGIISANHQLVTINRLKQMTGMLQHRGPDDEGHWINETGIAGLGHRRLSIIDLSDNGAQPMHYLHRYSIIHNGEIYNYIELKKELAAKGYSFVSTSDTEVILAAYDCWKENCLQHFDGMFAFAIWDEKEKQLFAARDRFGEKPFYYYYDGTQLVFASEIKALLATGAVKKINEALLYNFITLGYTQNPGNASESAYKEIYTLPAASFFIYDAGNAKNINPKKYWAVEKNKIDNSISETTAIEKFTSLFTESIKNRLRSDVPLGTSLSGGLDSSSIAVMINQLQGSRSRLQTFSAIFPGFAGDESKYIQLLAEKINIDNFTVCPTAENFIDDFEKLCYYQEGFMNSSSVYAQYKVFELAKQHNIKVLLDGQGADETLAGYTKYYHWFWQELYTNNQPLLKKELAAARELGVTDEWTWKNKLAALHPSAGGAYLKKARIKKQLSVAGLEKDFTSAFGVSYYQLPVQDSLTNVLYYNTFNNGLEELLRYADRNSMAHGREVRLPFLHHQLVEFIFSLPSHFKIKDGRTKWIVRKAMSPLLPAPIAWRKDKIGFEPPQKQWLQQPAMQEYIMSAKQKLASAGILQKKIVAQRIEPKDANAADDFDWRYLVAANLL